MEYPLPVAKRNGIGKSKDNKMGMEQMNNKKTRHIVIATHPEKNMSTMREHEEEDQHYPLCTIEPQAQSMLL